MRSNNIDHIDTFLNDIYFHNKSGGCFLEAGAYDGIGDSITYPYQKQLNWRGILLQPNKSLISKIKRVRSEEDIVLNLGLGNKTQTAQFQILPSRLDSSSFVLDDAKKKQLAKIGFNGQSTKQLLQLISYKDLVRMLDVSKIDLAVIDIEGMQNRVLQNILQTDVHPTFLVVQHIYSDKDQLCNTVRNDYDLIKDINKDFIFKRRYNVALLTRCTRVQNLNQIKQNIENLFKDTQFNYSWIIGCNSKFITSEQYQNINKQYTKSDGRNNVLCKYIIPTDYYRYDGDIFNHLLSQVESDYVYCLDDDNILHPQFLNTLRNNIENNFDICVIDIKDYIGSRKNISQDCFGKVDTANLIYSYKYLNKSGGFIAALKNSAIVQDALTFSKCLQSKANILYTQKQAAYYNYLHK